MQSSMLLRSNMPPKKEFLTSSMVLFIWKDSDINTAVRLMKEELNTIGQAVGQLQGQVNELNARLSTPAPTPSS
ncbi:hypothetical protein V8E54_014463 [Elaphomyces granulatus]